MTIKLVTLGEVQKLTGLTSDQIREWTHRRGLIKPDVEPNGPGSRARYSWQTILLLRLAVALKGTFHIELQSQRDLFASLTQRLAKMPFHALRECAVVVQADAQYEIVRLSHARMPGANSLVIRLDPHLDVLATDFGLVEPTRQLPLFPVVAVR